MQLINIYMCSFDTVCSFGPNAPSFLGGQPACDCVASPDAAPSAGPAAEHCRAAQTAVATAQHTGVFIFTLLVAIDFMC